MKPQNKVPNKLFWPDAEYCSHTTKGVDNLIDLEVTKVKKF